MQKEDIVEESWDKKKIVIAIALVIALISIGITYKDIIRVAGIANIAGVDNASLKSVEGVQTKQEAKPVKSSVKPYSFSPAMLQNDVQKKVEEIKQEVSNLSLTEIASSSPEIQKIMKDIQGLQQYPKTQAKEACFKLCEGFK